MITEAELSYEDMKQAEAKGYLCAKCQSRLFVAWGGMFGTGWILRCNNIEHTGMTRHDIKYEKQKREAFSMDSVALTKMNEAQMVERVNMARFPQEMTAGEKKLLAQVAITYGFDPLMGEVTLYQGRPFVSIDGRYRAAQETNMLDGVETRPATKDERSDWKIPEGDYFFRSEVYVKGASRAFIGWGRVYQAETVGGKGFKPVEKNPQRMAEKRAEAQALRKAFHIPLPSIEDIGSPDYDIESTATEVNTTTGEIIETKHPKPKEPSKPKKPEPEEQQETPPEAVTPTGEASEEPDSIIDLEWLKEQQDELLARGLTSWDNKGLRDRIDKITGSKSAKVSEAVNHLSKEQAEGLIKQIQETLEMA